MRHVLLALSAAALLISGARAADIESAYTKIDRKHGCKVVEAAARGDGDWQELACTGYKGYPVLISYDDARESIFYGYPPKEGKRKWESFAGFNQSSDTIEWRVAREGKKEIPFATIHRWFVGEPGDTVEVLAVEKIGRKGGGEGCAVGYVVASGNGNANDEARRIADSRARDFSCDVDKPVIKAGRVALPALARQTD
ncbi:hypothetical protein ATN84_06535 [Paramesorhizobium deserti]|uniref:Uncharacterized protein n=1 Tax=Paramesorhizobium deserti TaxID=1494590 RepID=A0A135I1P1_9HYPH|nr:hypothetical protein [Paramesorhizobium deserti]KXF79362.1 hypothetical protein ATN84_06535 [Paramesorhizobium deserti]